MPTADNYIISTMKIIISHDVDHLLWSEHWAHDMFIPKYWARTMRFFATGKLPPGLALRRLTAPLRGGRSNNIEELSAFDRAHGISSTFFIGMRRGLGLSYSMKSAADAIMRLRQNGHEVGVHGMAYQDQEKIKEEAQRFQTLVPGAQQFGIRNHYLRTSQRTPELMAAAGYAFDSTEDRIASPYRLGNLVEFPVCLMDSYMLSPGRNDPGEVREQTRKSLRQAERDGVTHFTIDTHDVYFSNLYPEHKAWYEWLVQYVNDQGYEICSFSSALSAIN